MFERYDEKARRTVFFARYEAGQLGSAVIQTEHLLLGILKENKDLLQPVYGASLSDADIRDRIVGRYVAPAMVSTTVDLPLSDECKRVLAFGADEAERARHSHIGTEHLLVGMLREEGCFAAELLRESGLTLEGVRAQVRASAELPFARARERPLGIGAFSSQTIDWGAAASSPVIKMEVVRVLKYAEEEAKVAGSPMGAWHLLVGLLRDEASPVAAALRESGLALEAVRERVRRMGGAG